MLINKIIIDHTCICGLPLVQDDKHNASTRMFCTNNCIDYYFNSYYGNGTYIQVIYFNKSHPIFSITIKNDIYSFCIMSSKYYPSDVTTLEFNTIKQVNDFISNDNIQKYLLLR